MYRDGRGIAQDDQEAVNWYRKAAEQGDADAQFNLGIMYAEGRGVTQDKHEAAMWFLKAAEQAEQGDEDAEIYLDQLQEERKVARGILEA
ncbi:conserved hypothetical protein [Gammaproteobacteria bacterium]